MYICVCRAVTAADVRRLADVGLATPDALIRHLRLDAPDCCGRCACAIEQILARAQVRPPGVAPARAGTGLAAAG